MSFLGLYLQVLYISAGPSLSTGTNPSRPFTTWLLVTYLSGVSPSSSLPCLPHTSNYISWTHWPPFASVLALRHSTPSAVPPPDSCLPSLPWQSSPHPPWVSIAPCSKLWVSDSWADENLVHDMSAWAPLLEIFNIWDVRFRRYNLEKPSQVILWDHLYVKIHNSKCYGCKTSHSICVCPVCVFLITRVGGVKVESDDLTSNLARHRTHVGPEYICFCILALRRRDRHVHWAFQLVLLLQSY